MILLCSCPYVLQNQVSSVIKLCLFWFITICVVAFCCIVEIYNLCSLLDKKYHLELLWMLFRRPFGSNLLPSEFIVRLALSSGTVSNALLPLYSPFWLNLVPSDPAYTINMSNSDSILKICFSWFVLPLYLHYILCASSLYLCTYALP